MHWLNASPAFHAFVRRPSGYQHHGIIYQIPVLGLWRAIHFNDGGTGTKAGAIVRDTPIEVFLKGDVLKIVPTEGYSFDPREVHARAASQIGRGGWNLLSQNCEHFARWCTTGKLQSGQIAAAGLIGAIVTILALAG